MIKEYTTMTRMERQFSDACRRVCLSIHQQEIYNDILNFEEQEIVNAGTKEDVKKLEHTLKKEGKPPLDSKPDFDWVCGNGSNNIARIAENRGVLPQELALDLALEVGLLNGTEHRRLVEKFIGEAPVGPGVSIKYIDNQLLINKNVACEVKEMKNSKLSHILRSFDQTAWQRSTIDFEVRYGNKQVADAVLALNKKQEFIQFSVVEYTKIRWKMR